MLHGKRLIKCKLIFLYFYLNKLYNIFILIIIIQVDTLFKLCPKQCTTDSTFLLTIQSQDAVIALGIYLLDSNLTHCDIIVPYLLELLKGLEDAQWLCKGQKASTDRKSSF